MGVATVMSPLISVCHTQNVGVVAPRAPLLKFLEITTARTYPMATPLRMPPGIEETVVFEYA